MHTRPDLRAATRPRIGSLTRYRRLRLAILLATVFITLYFSISRITGVGLPRSMGFRLIMVGMVACTLAWWSFADEALRCRIARPWPQRLARIAVAIFSLAMLEPVARMLLTAHMPSFADTPVWWVSAFQLWHMGLFLLLPTVAAIAYLIYWIIAITRSLRAGHESDANSPVASERAQFTEPVTTLVPATASSNPRSKIQDPKFSPRREFLKTAGIFAPVAVFGGLTVGYGRQTGRFRVNRFAHPAPWLPERLRGLTLTHVSDLHVGRLYRPWMLPRLVDEVNRLNSDIVIVTGDIIDMSNDMLPPTAEAIRQFQHRHGRLLCLGNHDLIDDRDAFIDGVRGAGLDLLIDQHRVLDIGGERLSIGGTDWTGRARDQAATSYERRARAMQWGYNPHMHGPMIAMAHHPHAFDVLADRGVPLTLSGHTHGGQLMLRPPHADGRGDPARDVGIGEMLFRYMRGFYYRGDSALFVNSGVGNWFPIRINAPAEIVQIQLV